MFQINPVSVVDQHVQQAGATPQRRWALQYQLQFNMQKIINRGMDPDTFLPRFTFFFDISISFLKKLPTCRAPNMGGIAKERLEQKTLDLGALNFMVKLRVDLTAQQP